MSLGLCVLGCGSFARVFARAITGLRDEIDLYFASRDLHRARDYAARFNGLDAFGSYAAAAADPRVDALYICTPHHLHLEHVTLAAREGKHVLVEKPIAATLLDGNAILAQAQTAGIKLMVAENYRFLPPVRKAKELIGQGRLGDLRLVQLQEQYPFQPSGWRNRTEQNGGGVFIDGGIHKVSALAYLAGRPNQVFAHQVPPGRAGLQAEDGIVVVTRSQDGVVGLINHSWSAAPPTPAHWVSISGSHANLYFEVGKPWIKLSAAHSEEMLELEDSGSLALMVHEFHQSILLDREPAMTGPDGIADLDLVLKAYESMALGLPVPCN